MPAKGLTVFAYTSGLRRDVDRLTASLADAERRESALLRQHGRPQVIRLRGLCVYCGHGPTQGTPATCQGHRGLELDDPHYGGGRL